MNTITNRCFIYCPSNKVRSPRTRTLSGMIKRKAMEYNVLYKVTQV